ncbi:MAG: hypothetical protein WA364_15085 [Candidatus Nitrosopolaris sp.]
MEQARTAPTNNTLRWFDKELEKHTAAKKSTAAEKPEASARVEANKEVEGTIKQGQLFGNSQIKVENQRMGDTDKLHTKESARELAMASQAKVEHAPTTPSAPIIPTSHAKTTKFALLGNAHLGRVILPEGGECRAGQITDYTSLRRNQHYVQLSRL